MADAADTAVLENGPDSIENEPDQGVESVHTELAARAAANGKPDVAASKTPQQGDSAPSPARTAEPAAASKTAAESAPSAPPTIDERTLNLAESWGIGREEAKAFGNGEALKHAVAVLQKRFSANTTNGQTGNATAAAAPQPAPQPQQPPAPPVTNTPPATPQAGFNSAFQFDIPAELMDPAVVDENVIRFIKTAKGSHDFLSAQIQRLSSENRQTREAFDQILGRASQSQVLSEINQLDAFVESLGKDGAAYGDGTSEDWLDRQTTPEYKKRDELYREVMMYRAGYAARNERPPSIRKLLKRAHNAISPANAEAIKQQAVTEMSERARDAIGRFIAPPTQRVNGAVQDPRAKAIATAAAFMKERGIGQYASETFD